jgi:curved DNA-binding protein CbpA
LPGPLFHKFPVISGAVSLTDPYAVLGLSRQASMVDIKKAYFKLVREHPPERDPEGFQRLRTAYEALRTPAARAITDRQLIQPPPPYVPPRRLPPYDLEYHPEDRWLEARRGSDLERTDFTADFRPIPDLNEVSI